MLHNTILIILFIIQAIIFSSWIYFLIYTIKSLKGVPKLLFLKSYENIVFPKVSVILPARNEQKYIEKCLDSLLKQDYSNYEIVAINDSSSDRTGEIIQKYSTKNSKIIFINAEAKPEGWTGKNWACYQGYIKSTGQLFLFTDADTTHSSSTISLAVNNLLAKELDALTAIPKILANDFWTKITLPILWTLSISRYSALKANDPKTNVGYFFGSFFIITKKTYEAVGTHKAVKEEIVEDGALGRKVKEQGFKLRVVHGEDHIQAVWARNSSTLWHGLRRLMVPLYKREKIKASLMVVATFLLLIYSLIVLPFSITMALDEKDVTLTINNYSLDLILLFLTIMSILLLIITNVLQLKFTIFQNSLYSLYFPLAGSFVFIAFLSSIINSGKKDVINWQGRRYSIKEN
ncbi:MAG: glycosyltransferase [Nitrososphaeraceae archaeon]|nr:glycosyltransferase [Nitrososphaeraceae archaeon]